MKITFRAKETERQSVTTLEIEKGYSIPVIKKTHCDMNAARSDKRFSAYANSSLFEGMVRGMVKQKYGYFIKSDSDCVKATGFLSTIEMEL